MTQAQMIGLAFLLLFGFVFDVVIEALRPAIMALAVVFGVGVTLFVLFLDSQGMTLTTAEWTTLALLHFAASGLGMTAGSWRRSL